MAARGAFRRIVITAVCAGPGAWASPALGDSCVQIAGGLYRSQGCLRSSGGARREDPWRPPAGQPRDPGGERPFEALHPRFPRQRLPFTPPKEGRTTLGDLQLVPDGKGGYRGSRPGFRFRIARDGTIHFRDRAAVGGPSFIALGALGVFDLTDLVIRLQGGDPYTYDKALVAGLTRPLREALTDEDRRARLKDALFALPGDLRTLWSRQDIDPGTRRAILFRLWDELVERDDAEDPQALAAARARILILLFIDKHLPAGSVDAYTDPELDRLNAERRSRQRFAPYAQPDAP